MKILTTLSALIFMIAATQVSAANLETLSCSQLQKARVISQTNFKNLYCSGKTANDSETLHQITNRMEFEGRRIEAIQSAMDEKSCVLSPLIDKQCIQDQIKEQNCKRAVSSNDYDAYTKYCL